MDPTWEQYCPIWITKESAAHLVKFLVLEPNSRLLSRAGHRVAESVGATAHALKVRKMTTETRARQLALEEQKEKVEAGKSELKTDATARVLGCAYLKPSSLKFNEPYELVLPLYSKALKTDSSLSSLATDIDLDLISDSDDDENSSDSSKPKQIGRAVQQECRDRSRMPSSA
eukprot:TRINITY_DN92003_c0_g1_i1.p1 TRINITY_DN92003_c0_g1~~TRINITY_DN92003_c0_g1_i1.p1  ORF type:complete len:194 (+),score=22.41 TRINITY_DN92003_c0_g1_i1:65-583(+)